MSLFNNNFKIIFIDKEMSRHVPVGHFLSDSSVVYLVDHGDFLVVDEKYLLIRSEGLDFTIISEELSYRRENVQVLLVDRVLDCQISGIFENDEFIGLKVNETAKFDELEFKKKEAPSET